MVGIKRLAHHLNISIGTVSRALNDRPDVNADTRQRVLKAAHELGYIANQSGRSLRRGVTGAIGFMIQTGPQFNVQGDNFFTSVFDGVQTVLNRHHLDLVVLLCADVVAVRAQSGLKLQLRGVFPLHNFGPLSVDLPVERGLCRRVAE